MVMLLVTLLSLGLLWAPDPHWKWLRSFCEAALGEESLEHISMDTKILAEIDLYVNTYIKPKVNTPVDISTSLNKAVYNVKSQLIFGCRIDYTDVDLEKILRCLKLSWSSPFSKFVAICGNIPLVNYLVAPFVRGVTTPRHRVLYSYIRKQLRQHKRSLHPNSPRDLLDCYLLHQCFSTTAGRQCFTGKGTHCTAELVSVDDFVSCLTNVANTVPILKEMRLVKNNHSYNFSYVQGCNCKKLSS